MTPSTWTEDRIGRLKTLWLDGWTADQIARALAGGVTRSAVLSKVYRMGLSAGPAARPAAKPVMPARPPAALPRRPVVAVQPPPHPVTPQRGLATVLSVRRCECRWPLEIPGGPTSACAAGR